MRGEETRERGEEKKGGGGERRRGEEERKGGGEEMDIALCTEHDVSQSLFILCTLQ